MFEQVLPEDLMHYGLIPEFVGRLPVISAIHQLTRDDLIRILSEPRNALVKQFQRFFSFDGIELHFADDVARLDRATRRSSATPARAACARSSRRSCSRCSSSCRRAAT